MSVLRVVLLVALITICAADWKLYKKTYNKSYNGREDVKRRALFKTNLKKINKHNFRYELGLTSYRMGVNHLTDLTSQEYKKLLGFKAKVSKAKHNRTEKSKGVKDLPDAIDWRPQGYVTSVKDQGFCESCWAFSVVGALEGQLFAKNHYLVELSAQNLVDCSSENFGCNGGAIVNGYRYIMKNKGINTESAYPYNGDDEECHYDVENIGARIASYTNILQNEYALKVAVATIGPISVAVDAGHLSFRFYRGGIYDNPDCTERQNHAVVVVGYGRENRKDYWLVKNSWGTNWGEKGYIKMARNKDNQCGIANSATYPNILD